VHLFLDGGNRNDNLYHGLLAGNEDYVCPAVVGREIDVAFVAWARHYRMWLFRN